MARTRMDRRSTTATEDTSLPRLGRRAQSFEQRTIAQWDRTSLGNLQRAIGRRWKELGVRVRARDRTGSRGCTGRRATRLYHVVGRSYMSRPASKGLTMRTTVLRHVGIPLGLLSLVVACTGGETRADSAAAPQAATPSSNWTADSSAIVATLAASRAGWNQADIDAHYRMYDDSVAFVYVPRGDDPPIRSLANVRVMAGDLFKGKKPSAGDRRAHTCQADRSGRRIDRESLHDASA